MSSPSNTTAKSPAPTDSAALAQAAKLIAGKPGMSPASALRKAGIKSAAKIKQLSVELRRQQADRRQRKASDAGSRRQSNRGQATARAKALSTSRGASRKAARSPEPVKPRKAFGPHGETTARSAVGPSSDLMGNWLKLYVGWWSQMMRWSPVGIIMSAKPAEKSLRDLASVQWFSNLRQ